MSPSKLEILAYEETALGLLCLRRRESVSQPGLLVTEVTLNHEFLMSSYHTDSERAISNRAVEIHGGQDLNALVGGLGLGYTAWELLNHPQVAQVEVVEYLAPVMNWMEQGLIPLSGELNNAMNLKLSQGDIYARLLNEPAGLFDLIVIDVDHSPDDQLGEMVNEFYSESGLACAKQHLNPGGVLAAWSYAESESFVEKLQMTFATVLVEPITTFNSFVNEEQTDWLFFGVS